MYENLCKYMWWKIVDPSLISLKSLNLNSNTDRLIRLKPHNISVSQHTSYVAQLLYGWENSAVLCSLSDCYCIEDPFFREATTTTILFFRLKNQYVKKLFSVRWLKIFCYEVIFIFIRLFSWNIETLSECLW